MSSAAKVGVFMLVVLGILGFFILKIEDLSFERGKQSKQIKVLFDSVAGLDEKSAVRVAGVRVGKVSKIKLTPDGRALVTLEVDKDVELHQGATAKVANLGLLGEKYIELDPGSARQPALAQQSGVTLNGTQPASIDDVTNQISSIATDVKAVTASLREVMGGPAGEQRLADIVENVHQITGEVRMLIAANEGNVNTTASNLRQITDDLRVEIPKIAASIDRVTNALGGTVGENRSDVREIVENLKGLSTDLKVTATNLNDITGKVRSGDGTIGKLFYSDEAHDRLVGALSSVESGVNELKNTLGRVNRMSLDVGINSEYESYKKNNLGFNDSSRSGVQVKIMPNPDINRFYNIELNEDPHGALHDKIVETTTTDPTTGVSSTVVTHETRIDRNFVISAQAGWQLDSLALRVGLFDSTGGAGADWRFNDRLTLTGEAFDFGEKYDSNPHLRVLGQYIVRNEKKNFPQVYVSTGVDNLLNSRAITIGAGIRWRDDDLKYLLGSVPLH